MTDTIELLTGDEDGNAIPGPLYPKDLGVAVWTTEHSDRRRLAYPCKFFRYDDNGQAMPDTLVEFLVPDFMMNGADAGPLALRMVAERMGWQP